MQRSHLLHPFIGRLWNTDEDCLQGWRLLPCHDEQRIACHLLRLGKWTLPPYACVAFFFSIETLFPPLKKTIGCMESYSPKLKRETFCQNYGKFVMSTYLPTTGYAITVTTKGFAVLWEKSRKPKKGQFCVVSTREKRYSSFFMQVFPGCVFACQHGNNQGFSI